MHQGQLCSRFHPSKKPRLGPSSPGRVLQQEPGASCRLPGALQRSWAEVPDQLRLSQSLQLPFRNGKILLAPRRHQAEVALSEAAREDLAPGAPESTSCFIRSQAWP